jgi:hypothetical protein
MSGERDGCRLTGEMRLKFVVSMARIVMVITALVCLACSSAVPVSPSTPSPEMGAPLQPQVGTPARIAIGQDVHGTLEGHGANEVFEVTPSSGGVLVARLNWTSPATLELWIGSALLGQSDKPMVVKVPVTAGQPYRVKVGDAAAWDYDDFFVTFTLTTAIE